MGPDCQPAALADFAWLAPDSLCVDFANRFGTPQRQYVTPMVLKLKT
jgi:hypothetical protein